MQNELLYALEADVLFCIACSRSSYRVLHLIFPNGHKSKLHFENMKLSNFRAAYIVKVASTILLTLFQTFCHLFNTFLKIIKYQMDQDHPLANSQYEFKIIFFQFMQDFCQSEIRKMLLKIGDQSWNPSYSRLICKGD